MHSQSTPLNLEEVMRRQLEAVNNRDFDTLMSFSTADAVYDTSPSGLGVYEGRAAARAFMQGWWDVFEELTVRLEELQDLGNGVTFAVLRQDGRPVGSQARVQTHEAHVAEWTDELIVRVTVYTDIDAGRAAAELLAASRA